jgi:uncharacterized repeat protein (TIGR01451 family)
MPSSSTGSTGDYRGRRSRWRWGLIGLLGLLVLIGTRGSGSATADPASPLTVTMTASPNPVSSGQEITYTITTVNTGGARVDNVGLSDQLNGVGTIQSPPGAAPVRAHEHEGHLHPDRPARYL